MLPPKLYYFRVMIKIELKNPVNNSNEIICSGISVDPINDNIFLIQLSGNNIIETELKNIKHVSSHES